LKRLSDAVISISGPALLIDMVSQKEIGKIMDYYSLCINIAIFLRLIFGGIVFAQNGYLIIFAMIFKLIYLNVILRLALIKKKVAAK
jgi:hypothetical protein